MAQYRGLEAIAKRMGWSVDTVQRAIVDDRKFLAYRRKYPRQPRLVWITNDDLIYKWELEQCRQARAYLRARRLRTKSKRGVTRSAA